MKKFELIEKLKEIDCAYVDEKQLPKDDENEPDDDQVVKEVGVTSNQMERLIKRLDLFLELLHEIKMMNNSNIDS